MEMVNAQARDYNLGKWGRKKKKYEGKKRKENEAVG